MALTLTRGVRRVSDQSLRHNMPVRPVEELLLHMVIEAGPWWARWMFIVEDELRRLVLSRLQEAHHLAIIGCLPIPGFLTMYLCNETVGDHFRLEVRG